MQNVSATTAIERYLRSGESDPTYEAWSGDVIERAKQGHDELLRALASEVKLRATGHQHPPIPDLDLPSWTRRKLTPMVHGLFPQAEREAVLSTLERSLVFLTSENIDGVLLGQSWLHTAWDLANLFLTSVGADLLGPDAVSILGLSEETTCFVSALYFEERGRTEDFVIHEAAHIFHNCKRRTIALPETRTREWLLPIVFGKRETFAYSCEGYGSIVEHAKDRAERIAVMAEFSEHQFGMTVETVAPEEVVDIVREACEARNGWKIILKRCSPLKPARPAVKLGTNDSAQ
jgi:hypothetical protein